MTTLNAKLDTLLHTDQPATQWKELLGTLINGQASGSATMWGTKVISVAGYSDTVSILDLAHRIDLAVSQYFINSEKLSRQERIDGSTVIHLMDNLHEAANQDLDQSSFIVRLLGLIQEVFFALLYGSFEENRGNARKSFRTFTIFSFREAFPGASNDDGIFPEWQEEVKLDGNDLIVSVAMFLNYKTPAAQS